MKDTPQYYGTLSRFFHWLMAAMFAFMLCTAAMWNINEKYYSLMGYHKSVGFLLLVLVTLFALGFLWFALSVLVEFEEEFFEAGGGDGDV